MTKSWRSFSNYEVMFAQPRKYVKRIGSPRKYWFRFTFFGTGSNWHGTDSSSILPFSWKQSRYI